MISSASLASDGSFAGQGVSSFESDAATLAGALVASMGGPLPSASPPVLPMTLRADAPAVCFASLDGRNPKRKENIMGLDMYALTSDNPLASAVDFKPEEEGVALLHRWRKHPNLHGWMEQLYIEKGGREQVFNCTCLALTLDDLDRLEAVIRDDALPQTEGFFFGESDGSEKEDDLDFIAKARAAIASGKAVFYDSWW